MAKVIVITSTNTISIEDFEEPLYDKLCAAVGGYIEIIRYINLPVPSSCKACMIVNEEGKLRQLRLNLAGSYMYGTHIHGHSIVGDIVLANEIYTEDGTEFGGFNDETADAIYRALLKTFKYLKEKNK